MTFAVRCSECATVTWPPLESCGSGGRSEIAALRLALEHVRETGHTEVEPIAGCHYVGDGSRPEGFAEGVGVEQCVRPSRALLSSDLQFAVESLQDEADRLERWTDAGMVAETVVESATRRLRERAELLERKQREREA